MTGFSLPCMQFKRNMLSCPTVAARQIGLVPHPEVHAGEFICQLAVCLVARE